MDQINCAMLHMLREISSGAALKKPAEKGEASPRFEKMMEEQRRSAKSDCGPEKRPAADEAEETVPAEPVKEGVAQEEQVWRDQMVWAAMSVLPMPVVSVETAELQAGGADMAARQMMAVPVETSAPVVAAAPMEQQEQQMFQAAPAPEETAASQLPVEPRQSPRMSADAEAVEVTEQDVEVTDVELPQQSLFGDVKAVPVKVGETDAMWQSQQPEQVEKQIMEPLAHALQRGESRVEIQLTPEYLGSVKVELTRHADGSLQVLLHAENPRTQLLLDKHASDLQSALLSQNQEPVRVVVHQQENQQQNLDYQREGGGGGHQQQQHQQTREHSQDFLQQLRLGLMPQEEETA